MHRHTYTYNVCVHHVHVHYFFIGEPENPVSAVPRNPRALTTSSAILGASDHDFTKFNLTPSVYLICDIPDSPTLSFYRGQPVVIVKDAVFSPSSPYRHLQRRTVMKALCHQ